MNTQDFEKELNLCLAKLNKETDKDWIEIVEELGLNIHYDTLRRMAYGYQKYNEYIKEKGLDSIADDMKNKLVEDMLKIKSERVKLSDERSLLNRQIREKTRFDSMLELAREISSNFNLEKPLLTKEPILKSGNKEAILLLSDLHIGIVNDNHWNKYDTDIMYKRMSFLRSRVVQIAMDSSVKKINVCLLGDIISGIIHSTIRLENREDIVKQCLIASEAISEFLTHISTLFEVDFYMSVGNHGRISANKSDSLDKENFEYFIKEMIKLRCSNVKGLNIVDNKIDDELVSFNVFNKNIVCSHGDKFGKLSTYIPKITSMLGQVPDYVCIGHLHNHVESSYGNTELIVNPSFSGVDTYSKNLGLVGRPSQKMLIFSEEYGKECTHQIYLDNIDE